MNSQKYWEERAILKDKLLEKDINKLEKKLLKLFKDARNENGNVILLMDEVDSLASKRGDSSNDKEKNNIRTARCVGRFCDALCIACKR